MLNTSPDRAARDVAIEIARVFNFTGVSLLRAVDGTHQPRWCIRYAGVGRELRLAAVSGTLSEDAATATVATSVLLGAEITGSLVLRGDRLSDSAEQSLANPCRYRTSTCPYENRRPRRSWFAKAKSSNPRLLDAIAHEFKTPLTSIKAAAAAALRSGTSQAPQPATNTSNIVDEESDRLDRLVTDAIKMARIEAGRVEGGAFRNLSPVAGRSIQQVVSSLRSASRWSYGDPSVSSLHDASKSTSDRELIQLARYANSR